jgi:Na+-translocating ferredoxin:NAD+ oxidoreductase subunit E
MSARVAEVVKTGLWTNNAGLVQLLGLCPLLAVSTSFINGLGLGLATTLVLVASNLTVSMIREFVRPEIRIPVFVLVIASFVTAVELVMNAWFHELFRVLGIFIPLIVTNCAIIGRAEAFASRQPPGLAALDGVAMGMGFTGVLVTLGAARELIGQGTLFAGAHMMFGDGARAVELQLLDGGFLLALLPPGAFIGLGLMVAAKNLIDAGLQRRRSAAPAVPADAAGEPA